MALVFSNFPVFLLCVQCLVPPDSFVERLDGWHGLVGLSCPIRLLTPWIEPAAAAAKAVYTVAISS